MIFIVHTGIASAQNADAPSRFVDHSLVIAPEYPCTWPTYPFPRFQLNHQRTIGPDSAYNIDSLFIDGNTGTQLDVPPHSVTRPDLKGPKSGPLGLAFTDKIEAWQFGGEACVVDVRHLLDQAPKGVSPLVTADHVKQFEASHRLLKPGDVVLFRSDYSDKYYRPFPEGSRFIADVVDRKAPAYPDPDPDCMEFLATRGVMTLGTDSASMGPMPNLAEPTHYAGLRHGMIWTESATNLGALPDTGAFYCMIGPRHQGGPYSEGRAFSIVGGELPKRLIEAARNKRAIDLSPVLAPNLPVTSPGSATGLHRQVYLKVDFLYSESLDLWHHGHLMDAMAGTHLVPPSFALPPEGTVPAYAPSSFIKAFEEKSGILKRGDVVVFHTGHLDRHLNPFPNDSGVWADPLSGKSEGWPVPDAEAIHYLKGQGIRCVATDAPDLGGVNPKQALMTYWALGSNEMVGVEFLYNVSQIPRGGYFLFAPLKIRDCHGGPGRAIVLN